MKGLTSIFSFICLSALALRPGIRTSISQNALINIKNSIVPNVITEIQANKIPDFDVKFGLLKINITDIQFLEFNLTAENVGVKLVIDDTISYINLELINLSFNATSKIAFRTPFLVKGTISSSLENTNLTIPIKIGTNKGKVSLEILAARGNLDSFKMRIKTDSQIISFFQLFNHFLPINMLTNAYKRKLVTHIGESFNPQIQKILNSIVYVEEIPNLPLSIDYHIEALQVVQNQYIEGLINGTFFLTKKPKLVPNVTLPEIPPAWVSSQDFKIQISEYFFDTFLWGLQDSGILNINITNDIIPKEIPITLSTTGLSEILPNLPKVYGNDKPINMNCIVSSPPQFTISEVGTLLSNSYCDFVVTTAENAFKTAFRLNMQAMTQFTGYVVNNSTGVYLFGSILPNSTEFTVFTATNSTIGPINLQDVQDALNYFADAIANYIDQKIENQGIVLPIPPTSQVENATMVMNENFIEIGFTKRFSNY
ncbi:unnamed protein product [Blepharisma stoltei]|uniref:Lipid-binding serum glycoprotein C-terminal domain-containing protein n=1 Tax=Blepharisma stoltei TaxID=1481888 RepID=A0AAU9J7F6_9CILI|nr:unnamed protein product [Blepharisma stoltei]